MIRILVADDHPIVRKGIKQILMHISKKYLIDETDNAQDAICKALKNDYEIITLDISMPKGGGLNALEQIMKVKPQSKILILSVYDESQYVMRSMKLGACGYLTKTSAADELECAIKKIRSGGKYITPSVSDKIIQIFDNPEKQKHENLTNREFQVFCFYAQGKVTGAIANDLSLSPKTITTYRSRILNKLNLKTNYDIIKYAMKYNLVIDSEK